MRSEAGKVKLVFVIDNMRLGGTELNAVRTAALLDTARYDVRVVCLGGEGPLTDRYRALGIPVTNLALRGFAHSSMATSGWRFARYLRRERADIVHAHDVYSNIFVSLWGKLARVPAIVVSRRWWHSLPNARLRFGNLIALRFADAVLANSPQVASSISVPADRKRVWVVPNFVDDAAFESCTPSEREARRAAWGIPSGSVVVGCVARLVPVKDHDTLLQAFFSVRERRSDVHLVLVGDGEQRQALERLATELGVGSSVTFAGEIRSERNLHELFDVSVLSSVSEGFPNTIVEAMAAAVPVIATAVGGTLDAIEHGRNGLLVPAQNPAALASALLELIGNPSLRSELGQAGRARAMQEFTATRAISELESLYKSLIRRL